MTTARVPSEAEGQNTEEVSNVASSPWKSVWHYHMMLNGDNMYVGFRSERKLALLTQKRR